jgi:hypothetical protein
MELTVEDLEPAKLENIERLALAVGAQLPNNCPRQSRVYARSLMRNVLYALRQDALRARRAEQAARARS